MRLPCVWPSAEAAGGLSGSCSWSRGCWRSSAGPSAFCRLWAACGFSTSGFAAADTDLRLALNVRVLAATLALCLLATLLFGLRPALLLSRHDIAGEMKGAAGRVSGSVGRKRGGLSMAGQIALAVALVLSAMLLTHCAFQIAGPDAKFALKDKLVIELDPESGGYNRVQSLQACAALADHLASLPQVQALGTTSRLFYGSVGMEVIGEYRLGWDQSGSGRPLAREADFIHVGGVTFRPWRFRSCRGGSSTAWTVSRTRKRSRSSTSPWHASSGRTATRSAV